MVALSGPGWRLAPSLIALVDEVDAVFPERDTLSDGSIGDTAHQARDSDHNPYQGYVHAVDLDEDLQPGKPVSLRPLWNHLIAARDPRIRYLIYEGQIVKSYRDPAGHTPWVPYDYTGPNDHERHLHVSTDRTATARDDLRPWGVAGAYYSAAPTPAPEEDQEMTTYAWFQHPAVDGVHLYALDGAKASACTVDGWEWQEKLTRFLSDGKEGTVKWNTRSKPFTGDALGHFHFVDGPLKGR